MPKSPIPNPPHTMKSNTPTITGLAFDAISLFATANLRAAFIIATDGSLGAGHFAFTGGPGGAPRASTASAGNLPAYTDSPQTFFTLGHAYGGTAAPHQYTFTYAPGSDPDNTVFATNTVFNLQQNLRATGLTGGGSGFYNIYRLHPANPSVSGGNTTYRLFINGVELPALAQAIDQNAANLATGENAGRWELIGMVAVPNASDTVAVTMTPDSSTFVSMRASGIMFEYAGPIPEPATGVLLGLGACVLLRRRRLGGRGR